MPSEPKTPDVAPARGPATVPPLRTMKVRRRDGTVEEFQARDVTAQVRREREERRRRKAA